MEALQWHDGRMAAETPEIARAEAYNCRKWLHEREMGNWRLIMQHPPAWRTMIV